MCRKHIEKICMSCGFSAEREGEKQGEQHEEPEFLFLTHEKGETI
jgi:hypothetical protein